MKIVVTKLLDWAGQTRSPRYKITAGVLGGIFFVGILPALLFAAGYAIEQRYLLNAWASIQKIIGAVSVVLGLLVLAWCLFAHIRIGRGTPVPLAPPQELIVTGPYRFSRNPIQFGACLYYFGLGAVFGSFAVGVIMVLVVLIIGGCYHKFIEEKELRERFGNEYEEYRKKTPFLLPKW
ncbi:MAG: isoprenylcysteine carboxylmethyltransferase family protein [Pseudomonadota bacterium]